MAQTNIIIGPNLKKVLPLNQILFLKELDMSGIEEMQPELDRLEQEIAAIPEYSSSLPQQGNELVYAHYFIGGSDWYILGWDRQRNVFYAYVVLNGDTQMAEYGPVAFKELDQFNKFPHLINLDFHWDKRSLNSVLGKPEVAGVRKQEADKKPAKQNFKYEFGCLMLDFEISNWQDVVNLVRADDVYSEPGFGIEDKPHVTVLFGFHQEVYPAEVVQFLRDYGIMEVKIELTGISFFRSEKYDVLKFDVKSEVLHNLNKVLRDKFPYTNSFPDYHPHMTIAYLKPGTGEKYAQKLTRSVFLQSSVFEYSYPDAAGEKSSIFFGLSEGQQVQQLNIELDFLPGDREKEVYKAWQDMVQLHPKGLQEFKAFILRQIHNGMGRLYQDALAEKGIPFNDFPEDNAESAVEWMYNVVGDYLNPSALASIKDLLISDTWFKNNPGRILGTEVEKPRGDRGEGAVEIIVKGTLADALARIEVPDVPEFEKAPGFNPETAKAKARALALAIEIELDLD